MLSGNKHSFGEDVDSVIVSSLDQSPQHIIAIGRTSTVARWNSVYSPHSSGRNERRRATNHGTWFGGDFTWLDHISTLENHRIRRRSMRITLEISDDIIRDIQAMNEVTKQEHLLKDEDHYGGEKSATVDEKEENVSDNISEYATH